MIPSHLNAGLRLLLIATFVVLFGIGAFLWLMMDLDSPPLAGRPAPLSSESRPGSGLELLSPSIPADQASGVITSVPGITNRGIVTANGRQIPVELAMDPASQERGLSYRPSLPDDEGMLFLFDMAQRQMFWMYEMHFPIDIIFIKGTRVVRVAADVPAPDPGALPAVVSSIEVADKVLEINAGKAKEWGIGVGTEIEISGSDDGNEAIRQLDS